MGWAGLLHRGKPASQTDLVTLDNYTGIVNHTWPASFGSLLEAKLLYFEAT